MSSCVVHVSLTDNRLCALNFYRATDIAHALFVNISAAERSNIIVELLENPSIPVSNHDINHRIGLSHV